MSQQNLTMYRNNDWKADTAVTLNGAVVDLTGGTLRLTAKWDIRNLDAAKVFAITSPLGGGTGITFTDAPNGKATLVIASSLTASLPAHRTNLVYDLQFYDATNKKYTIMSGQLTVLPDVTLTVP